MLAPSMHALAIALTHGSETRRIPHQLLSKPVLQPKRKLSEPDTETTKTETRWSRPKLFTGPQNKENQHG
jgi:hypothetical protein